MPAAQPMDPAVRLVLDCLASADVARSLLAHLDSFDFVGPSSLDSAAVADRVAEVEGRSPAAFRDNAAVRAVASRIDVVAAGSQYRFDAVGGECEVAERNIAV